MEEFENQNTNQKLETSTPKDKRRHFLAAFFLSFMWGVFGVDRFYLGKIWTGLLKLLTFGGFGIWAIVDLTMIMSGGMRDRQGNELIDAAKYKKFAALTVLLFALVLGAVILISGLTIIYAISEFINNGGIEKLIPSLETQMPSLDQLNNLNVNS